MDIQTKMTYLCVVWIRICMRNNMLPLLYSSKTEWVSNYVKHLLVFWISICNKKCECPYCHATIIALQHSNNGATISNYDDKLFCSFDFDLSKKNHIPMMLIILLFNIIMRNVLPTLTMYCLDVNICICIRINSLSIQKTIKNCLTIWVSMCVRHFPIWFPFI